jgi:argininosuccinate lyase
VTGGGPGEPGDPSGPGAPGGAPPDGWSGPFSGRIDPTPAELLHTEVLDPQFRFEVRCLLPGYLWAEKVLLAEYVRMRTLDPDDAAVLAGVLATVEGTGLVAEPGANLSDLAFAIERHVQRRLPRPVPRWHVDRSRNDLQATAQLMFGRARLARSARLLLDFGAAVRSLAERGADLPMPGYTHFQAAQVITAGFYFAAVVEQVLHSAHRLLATYDAIDACPLGAGPMAGQELPWDRDRMARLLGFQRPQPSALSSVASRGWALEATAELSILGCAFSRFATDLLSWGGSQYGFLDLPPELSGISAAMPQKKNFPVLERIRGRTAHLTGYHVDMVLGQRNTPFSNLVEVSKEAGRHLADAFDTLDSVLRLFRAVVDGLSLRADRMLAACEQEYLGGFALANALTLTAGLAWRTAQVVAGRYVVLAVDAGLPPHRPASDLLRAAAAEHGVAVADPQRVLAGAFAVRPGLHRLASAGSANPAAVRELIRQQAAEHDRLLAQWQGRARAVGAAEAETDRLLGLPAGGAGGAVAKEPAGAV